MICLRKDFYSFLPTCLVSDFTAPCDACVYFTCLSLIERCGSVVFQASLDEQKSIFSVQLQNDFYTFKNGNFFIAFKHGGTIKKNRADKNGRSVKRSTRFVLIERWPSRKRRFPTGSDFRQADLQRRWVAAKVRTSAKEIQTLYLLGMALERYNLQLNAALPEMKLKWTSCNQTDFYLCMDTGSIQTRAFESLFLPN